MAKFKFYASDRAQAINWVLDEIKQKLEKKHNITVREIGDYRDAHKFGKFIQMLSDVQDPVQYEYESCDFKDRYECKGFINKVTAELAKEYEVVKKAQDEEPDTYQKIALEFTTKKITAKEKNARMGALDATVGGKDKSWEMIEGSKDVTDKDIMKGVEELASKGFKVHKSNATAKVQNGAADKYFDPDGKEVVKKKFWQVWK